MASDARLAHQRELAEAGETLGHWLEQAGAHPDDVPAEVWRRIAEAAARGVAAATALAVETPKSRD
jgi:hypothetical protein